MTSDTMIKRMQQGMAVFFCGERIRQFFVFLGVWTFLGFYKVLLWMQYMDVPFIFQCRSQLYVMAFSDMYMWALLFPFISYLTRRTFKNQKWYIHVLKQVPMSIVSMKVPARPATVQVSSPFRKKVQMAVVFSRKK